MNILGTGVGETQFTKRVRVGGMFHCAHIFQLAKGLTFDPQVWEAPEH